MIGGRWRDILLVKGRKYVKGERNFLDISEGEEAPNGYTWASGAVIKNIDFNKMMEGQYQKAIRLWEIVVEDKPLKDGEKKPNIFYKADYFIEKYKTKENFAKQNSIFYTYALLVDGKWYQSGNMDWFGIDDSTEGSIEEFELTFNKIMNAKENQDKFFVLVDCHI